MIIGIDIDDTLTNTSELLLAYVQKYDYEVLKGNGSINKEKVYSIINGEKVKDGMGWTTEENNAFKDMYHANVLENAPIKPFAKEIINKLIEEGDEIIFITARNNKGDRISDSYSISKRLLDKNEIKYNKIITECEDKLLECKKIM